MIEFVNDYIDEVGENFDSNTHGADMRAEWSRMLDFVERNFPHGFKKGATNSRTPRVRFEAIAVGVALALRQSPKLTATPQEVAVWAFGDEFNKLVSSDGANSRPRIKSRIEYVRDHLLGAAI